jgi:hypothetical protein
MTDRLPSLKSRGSSARWSVRIFLSPGPPAVIAGSFGTLTLHSTLAYLYGHGVRLRGNDPPCENRTAEWRVKENPPYELFDYLVGAE